MSIRILIFFGLFCLLTGFSKPNPSNNGAGTPPSGEPAQLALHWLQGMQHSSGLVESAEGTNFVSLYDNSLAALVFMKTGSPDRARRIFNYFKSRMQTEFRESGGGFFQVRDTLGNNRERLWMGDNVWLLIALRHYRENYRDTRYDDLIAGLDKWLRSLQLPDGSLRSGYRADGSPIPPVTEGMISAYGAVSGNDAFHQRLMSYLQRNRWHAGESVFLAQEVGGRYAYALDLHSLAALIWPGNGQGFLDKASRYLTVQKHHINQQIVGGYCFDTDRDVVWLEGSAQMALAFRQNGLTGKFERTQAELRRSFIPAHGQDGGFALPYAANRGSTFGAAPLWQHASGRPALSSTAWYLFAELNFNPFDFGESPKPLPSAEGATGL